jgi:phage terminase large subunit-like protein
MPEWSTACPDWEDRIRDGRSLMPCGPLFPAEAEAGLEVFRSLYAVGVSNPGAGVDEHGRPVPPTYGEIARPWITEIAETIHGAYNVETGERLIREVLLKVPKKNWKSGIAAGLMLSLMVRNWRESNEGAVIAPTKETADNVFKPMRDAIKADPDLETLFHIQPNVRTITHRVTGMTCRVYAADTDTVAGKVWAFVIFEELWLLAQRAGAVDMELEATGGQASRPEGIVISITTESDDEPVGIYKSKLEFARAVRDGKVSAPHFLPLLYEWPAAMLKSRAYMEPENFHLVNPNYGASVDPDDMLRKFEAAKAAGGEALRVFLAKRLNVPPSDTAGGSWAGSEFWAQNGDRALTLDVLLERSEVVTVGIDGGGLDDLLGVGVIGREHETGRWLHWARAWAHPIALQRQKQHAERYRGFEADGDLVIVTQVGEDVEAVAAIVEKCEKAGLLDRIGVDTAGIASVVQAVEKVLPEAQEQKRIVGIPQGWKLKGAIDEIERRLAGRRMTHGGSKLMAWCVSSARVQPNGAITKAVSSGGKIDPLMATFDAGALMALNPAPRSRKFQMFVLG